MFYYKATVLMLKTSDLNEADRRLRGNTPIFFEGRTVLELVASCLPNPAVRFS